MKGKYNPELRDWRGRSYKAGGTRVNVLREQVRLSDRVGEEGASGQTDLPDEEELEADRLDRQLVERLDRLADDV